MIQIINKDDCCGCMSCVQRCPKHCIKMEEDQEGFIYPSFDISNCVDCHLCERVCPVINQSCEYEPNHVFAARNKDRDVLASSSSGGIFSIIAEKIIKDNGVVYGATFNDIWEVCHKRVDTIDDLSILRGSKYVQSIIGTSYIDAEIDLKAGRKVLFSGTPCQIAGLHKFLRKKYDNLFCVDVICHGSPSPGIRRDYLKELIERPKGVAGKNTVLSSLKEKPVITGISFRDKSDGWKKYGFVIRGKSASKADKNSVLTSVDSILMKQPASQNLYFRGFLNNLYLRPSCYKCPARHGKSGSDILLGDFWGINRKHPEFSDPLGVSLVLTYTDKGRQLFESLDCMHIDASYDDALDCNANIEIDEPIPKNRSNFFDKYQKEGILVIDKFCKQLEPGMLSVIFKKILYKLKIVR